MSSAPASEVIGFNEPHNKATLVRRFYRGGMPMRFVSAYEKQFPVLKRGNERWSNVRGCGAIPCLSCKSVITKNPPLES